MNWWMKFSWRCGCFFWAVTIASLATVRSADESFKVMTALASLDGHFAIGYGVNDLKKTPLRALREAPEDDVEFDQRFRAELQTAEGADPVNLKNYLVDLRKHRAVAVLPGFRYFPGKNHPALEVGWSVDGKSALAIYRERYCNGAIAWIDTVAARVTRVRDSLEKDFDDVLTQDKGKAYTRRRKDYAISFFDPIVTNSGEVIVGWAEAYSPKKTETGPEFDYALRFRVARRHGQPHLVFVCGVRDGGDYAYDQPLDNPQKELADAYRELRIRLHGSARRTLDREQTAWQRFMGDERGLETDWRARELEVRRDLLLPASIR